MLIQRLIVPIEIVQFESSFMLMRNKKQFDNHYVTNPNIELLNHNLDFIRPDTQPNEPLGLGIETKHPNRRIEAVLRKDSLNSIQSNCIDASSYASLPPSPAVSFLSSLAEITKCPGKQPTVNGWEGEAIGDYCIGRRIGVGNYAEVYEAEIKNDMTEDVSLVAVKIISKRRNPTQHSFAQEANPERTRKELVIRIQREVSIWRQLKHPNIVKLYEVIERDDNTFVFSEYCKQGHLLDYINSSSSAGLAEDIARYIFRNIVDAVYYLHEEMHVVHRDLKPENILLTTDYSGHLVAKLCDFGLSEYFLPPHQAVSLPTPPSACHSGGVTPACVGSLAYCSPEEIDQSLLDVPPPSNLKQARFTHPSPTSDIWSLGIVLYAMLTGRLPFDDDYMPRLQLQILSGEFEPLHARTGRDYSKQVDDLVHGLLELNIYRRLDIRAIKRHEWLAERC